MFMLEGIRCLVGAASRPPMDCESFRNGKRAPSLRRRGPTMLAENLPVRLGDADLAGLGCPVAVCEDFELRHCFCPLRKTAGRGAGSLRAFECADSIRLLPVSRPSARSGRGSSIIAEFRGNSNSRLGLSSHAVQHSARVGGRLEIPVRQTTDVSGPSSVQRYAGRCTIYVFDQVKFFCVIGNRNPIAYAYLPGLYGSGFVARTRRAA